MSYYFVENITTNPVNKSCYLVPITETLAKLKQYISGSHWEIIQRTLFAPLIEIKPFLQKKK